VSKKLTKVEFTNLDKVLYPKPKIKKSQIIQHFIKMAPRMLECLAERPVVLTRFPDGVDKEGFYEKDAPMGTPSWVKTFKRYSETAQREVNYIVCNDVDTLLWLANLAALEIHMTLSGTMSFLKPDFVLFDVDPEPPATFDDTVEVARALKEKLDSLRLRSYVKTSGKKGLHVVVPVVKEYSFEQLREFAHLIGKSLAKSIKNVVSEFPHSRDPGTVFIDYLQNSHGRTMVSPYSLRATPNATVSTPLEWDDIHKGLKPEDFNILTVQGIKKTPWKGLLKNRQKLEANLN
jgi:bifunctional non-homologous end joining protein LigD